LPVNPDFGFQGVWQPYPNQAILPVQFIDKQLSYLLKKKATNVTTFSIDENWSGETTLTPSNISNSTLGFKFFGKAFGFDFSLNFVRRQNDIPYVNEIYLTNLTEIPLPLMDKTNVTVESKHYKLDYHKETEVGFDFEKDWGIFVNRFELALIFPDETKTTTYSLSKIPIPIPPHTNYVSSTNEEVILKEPYVKWVIGLDRQFDGGWYINFQYARGLFIERGYKDERLQDYFTFNLEKSFFDEKLKLKLYGIANVDQLIDRFKDSDIVKSFVDNSAIMGSFEIVYSPVIGLDIKMGIMGLDGNGDATLARYKEYDMFYIQLSTGF